MLYQVLSVGAPIGLQFSRYRTNEEDGRGGMGVVFYAHDEHLNREVAIKVLSSGTLTAETERKHSLKDTLALCKLNRHAIATIRDFDIQQGRLLPVMEYILGTTPSEKVDAGPPPGWKFCYRL